MQTNVDRVSKMLRAKILMSQVFKTPAAEYILRKCKDFAFLY